MGMKPRKLPIAAPPRELPTVANFAHGAPLTLGDPEPVPERTPENLICLRGPCRYFWSMETMGHSGNPASYWRELGVAPPRQRHLSCLRDPSGETDFTDDNVFTCNQWDPLLSDAPSAVPIPQDELTAREYRRRLYEQIANGSEPEDIDGAAMQADDGEFFEEIGQAAEDAYASNLVEEAPEEEETDIP